MPPKVAPKTPKPLADDVAQAIKEHIDALKEEILLLIEEKLAVATPNTKASPGYDCGSL